MLRRVMSAWLITAIVILMPSFAMAIPELQLWIDGGVYDTATGTWTTTDEDFTLSAFATTPTTDVRLCIALSDDLFTLDANGNVILNSGTGISLELDDGTVLTQDDLGFEYGVPPSSPLNPDGGGGDLGPHGVYPTAFAEVIVDIDSPATIFDTQPLPDGTFGGVQDGYAYDFLISNAVAGIHFDLYTIDSSGDIDKFAPFTHDAETVVPEPSTLALLGIGVLLLPVGTYFRRKQRLE